MMKQWVHGKKMASKSSENLALKFLLSVAALRTAPKTQAEICAGSNQQIGNVLYINPEDLAGVGLPNKPIQKLFWRPGYEALILATPLIPRGGCIYAPLNQAVLDQFNLDLHVDDFADWNHTRSGGTIINANARPELKALIEG